MPDKKNKVLNPSKNALKKEANLPSRLMVNLADEIAKLVVARLPKIPRKEKIKKIDVAKDAYFLDTSAIIDGRILDFFKTGFVGAEFVILDTVLMELKHIADAKEESRKARGRKALEDLDKFKKTRGIKFIILPIDTETLEKYKEVDEQIIRKAKEFRGKLITCDYNLEKKSKVESVATFNVYAFADIFKIVAIPGDTIFIKIVHIGKNRQQGVGYTDDGTMIVVENAGEKIGQIGKVIVTKILQSDKGKIIFANLAT